jgi:quinol monooxygenase YgiN
MHMKVSSCLLLAASAAGLLFWGYAFSKSRPGNVVVRMAQLEIDPTRLEEYTRAVREEMEDAVRLEPGVLAIYAVAEKDNPTRLHFFEIYTSEAAYASHRDTPHFQKYLALTKPMIRDRKLIEAIPVQMSDKAGR